MPNQPSTKQYLTFDEIVGEVYFWMNDDEAAYLKTIQKDDMIQFHHGVGTSIRNEFGLWDKNNPLTKQWFVDNETNQNKHIRDGVDYHPQHPDTVSSEILEAVWEKVNHVD